MIIVQIKTPFNISDLKTSLLLSAVFYFFLLLSSILLFPYPPHYFCSSPNYLTSGEPPPDPFFPYRILFLYLSFLSFIPAFAYYFMKNKFELSPAILLLVVLILFTVVCAIFSVFLRFFIDFFPIDLFRSKSIDICSNLSSLFF